MREHFIPKFILCNFTDEFGKLSVFDKSTAEHYIVPPEKVFAINNLYETKNIDGSFYNRNQIEEILSQIENKTAKVLNHFNDLTQSINKGTTCNDFVSISEYLAVQLLRGPEIQRLIQKTKVPLADTNERFVYEHALKQELFIPNHESYTYLEQNGYPQSIQTSHNDWSLQQKTSFYLYTYFSGILLFAPDERKFWIGDCPVLIKPFASAPNIQYLLPLSQYYVFCWRKKQSPLSYNNIVIEDAPTEFIDIVNSQMFYNANKQIVFNKTDLPRIMDLYSHLP